MQRMNSKGIRQNYRIFAFVFNIIYYHYDKTQPNRSILSQHNYFWHLCSGMACDIGLALDRTSLSLSHGCQSTPAPAEQVVDLRWMCGSYHLSRINSATVDLNLHKVGLLLLQSLHLSNLKLRNGKSLIETS